MNSYYDLQQLLKNYNIVIYMKDKKHKLQLVEYEVRELYRLSLINQNEFLRAMAIIKKEFYS